MFGAAALLRLCGSRPRPSRLIGLHADEDGGSQSLSFVLTLPIFAWFMVLIIQISQLMIATVLVHYAAFAAARAAIVWIPAQINATSGYGSESENCIGNGSITFTEDGNAVPANVLPEDPSVASSGPTSGGMTYIVPTDPTSCANSYKLTKILNAAILACLPMSPSGSTGLSVPPSTQIDPSLLASTFSTMTAGSAVDNGAVPQRFRNKLAWAANNTSIELRFYHANGCDTNGNVIAGNQAQVDPPLGVEYPGTADPYPALTSPPLQPPQVQQPYPVYEYQPNEIGWQDSITVTVHHNLALLPIGGWMVQGITRFGSSVGDAVIGQATAVGNTYICPLTAKATLGLEGEKSVVPYVYSQ